MCARDRVMKVLRIDNQYVTADIQKWAATISPGRPAIQLQPCIPHEHHTIGDVERFNRTLEDAVFKKLYGKPHLTPQYWGMAYLDYIFKSNITGSVHDDPPISPHELWFGEKPDALKLPRLPFGSIVMAHIPVAQQTTASGRATLTYCVGTAVLQNLGGLKLFNPATKRESIRRTFKTIGPVRQPQLSSVFELT